MPGKRLTKEQRVRIEALWSQGVRIPAIAVHVGCHRTTVWRELKQYNSYRHGVKHPGRRTGDPATFESGLGGLYLCGYRADWAQRRAEDRARRPRTPKCGYGQPLRPLVLDKLKTRWSPEQIAAWLKQQFPDQPEMWMSHETIYQAIYVQSRGNLRAELKRQVALRSGRTRRRTQQKAGGAVRSTRPWITTDFHISKRPAEADDRAVPGHWEGDLVIGARGSSAMITLVERATRFVMLGALPDSHASEQVIAVLSQLAWRLPDQLWRSLAWDCGSEMTEHATFGVATDCPVFFCDPHSPWQRGSNENTNGLLRQYFPKGVADFRTYSQADLDNVAAELNGRPRKTLAWQNPAQALNKHLVATAT